MQGLSKSVLTLAENALARPTEQSSREAVATALLLAHVAWNRVVDPLSGDQLGYYRKVLQELSNENPACLDELKSSDVESLIRELVRLKSTLYPDDRRIIHGCGLTAHNTGLGAVKQPSLADHRDSNAAQVLKRRVVIVGVA